MQHSGKGHPVSKGKEEFIEFIEQGDTEDTIKPTKNVWIYKENILSEAYNVDKSDHKENKQKCIWNITD